MRFLTTKGPLRSFCRKKEKENIALGVSKVLLKKLHAVTAGWKGQLQSRRQNERPGLLDAGLVGPFRDRAKYRAAAGQFRPGKARLPRHRAGPPATPGAGRVKP